MQLTPDEIIYWQWGPVVLNATIVYSWGVMLFLVFGSWGVTRKLSTGPGISRWQNLLEVVVQSMRDEIRDISRQDPAHYLAFVGTLFLFILVPSVLSVVPGFKAPTASLSTTAGLAACVFVAVPMYGIAQQGVAGYFKNYLQPAWFMLPFNIIGELSRTIALAVRLFGNMMSVSLIVVILLSLTPLFFPVVMHILGLITGVIHAYIFAILAMVYISAATRVHARETRSVQERETETDMD